MKVDKRLIDAKLRMDDLYGKVVRAEHNENSDIGATIIDPAKIQQKIYDIKVILDELVNESE